MNTRITLATLAVLALGLSGHPAGAAPDKNATDFLMDLGSVQIGATAIRKAVLTNRWKPAMTQISLLTQSVARARAFPGTTPDQKPFLDALQRDALALQAAGAARSARLVDSTAQAVSLDATAIVAHAPRLTLGASR